MRKLKVCFFKQKVILLGIGSALFLSGCSESKPDGHVYTMNGVGMTLPLAGIELTFLPFDSRADFFHNPLSEAYTHATNGLDTLLEPSCAKASEVIPQIETALNLQEQEVQQTGNLPQTPEACMNMCVSRNNLEAQRDEDKQQLNQGLSQLDKAVTATNDKITVLQKSRSQKSGELDRKLQTLKKEREKLLQSKADQLVAQVMKKISFKVGTQQVRFNPGERVSVLMENKTDYAMLAVPYNFKGKLEGYYQGVKIKDYTDVSIPEFGLDDEKTDSLGFKKGYLLASGEAIRIRVSIYDLEGLNMSNPSAKLLARERGWKPNSQGYILPDEIRIAEFPEELFVIPDDKGTRTGSTIVYHPKRVDFRSEVARKGLPQDNEIARLSKQLETQSYPEDNKIVTLENEISDLNSQKKSLTDAFIKSPAAIKISDLNQSESLCRSSREQMSALKDQLEWLSEAKSSLRPCGTEELDPRAVYSTISYLNTRYSANISLPYIGEGYTEKARELIWSKLAASSAAGTHTSIDGSFSIDSSVDQSNSLAFGMWSNTSREVFWMQPLTSLDPHKDLNYNTSHNGSFEEYLERVINIGGDLDLKEFSLVMASLDLEAPDPNELSDYFTSMARRADLYDSVEMESDISDSTTLACEM